ncbi:MAG: DUF503 domain-containing protein [Kofleriaceae bacterium]|nr:DUF503 domain-containing protein [Myxococcales bacterium]MCB9573189.1 DUF503 domain-containing protein [Kofleriaceae bacterium]
MHVGICRFTLLISQSHSLKEKRRVLRRVRDKAKALGVTIAEVGAQDTWQRAELAFAVVAGERDRVDTLVAGVVRHCAGLDGAQLVTARREVLAFGDDWYASAADITAAWDDKAAGEGGDLSWVPSAWLSEEEP